MECTVEAISSTRKKLTISLSAEEVNAAVNATVADYRNTLALPGFRRGKVPTSVIERRFGKEVLARATQNKLNAVIDQAMADNNLSPLSSMESDNSAAFKRNEVFTCTLSFEVLPDITFPNYIGLPVEQPKVVATEAEQQEILDSLRSSLAELTDVTEDRLPVDGNVVDVTYSGTDENGNALDDVKGEHFSIILGQGQALPDFEALVKTAKQGETKTGPVTFPTDYAHEPLAGKTVTFTITLNSIKNRNLPELNDEFAQKVRNKTLEDLKADINKHIVERKTKAAQSGAMQKLLDGLLQNVSFDIPEGMLNSRIERILSERAMRLERLGKKLEDTGKSTDELRKEAEAEAIEALRPQIFLMALGRKEQIEVSDEDVAMAIYSTALRTRQDPEKIREAYLRSGLIYELRDRLLADKTMNFIYSKAAVTEVEPATTIA